MTTITLEGSDMILPTSRSTASRPGPSRPGAAVKGGDQRRRGRRPASATSLAWLSPPVPTCSPARTPALSGLSACGLACWRPQFQYTAIWYSFTASHSRRGHFPRRSRLHSASGCRDLSVWLKAGHYIRAATLSPSRHSECGDGGWPLPPQASRSVGGGVVARLPVSCHDAAPRPTSRPRIVGPGHRRKVENSGLQSMARR